MSVSVAPGGDAIQMVPAGNWSVDPSHSSVEFQVKHMMVSTMTGRFTAFEGTLETDEAGVRRAWGTIEVASLDTHEPKRDEHLRSSDFFDAARYPEIAFGTREVVLDGSGEMRLIGDITIRGRTRPLELIASLEGVGTDPWGNQRLALRAYGELDRREFGLTWNEALEAGGALVADRVRLELDILAVQTAAGVASQSRS